MSAVSTLFAIETRRWLTRRGFLLAVMVAAIPMVLTAAWLLTHEDDVSPTQISWSPQEPEAGGIIDFTATIENRRGSPVGMFDVLLRVGFVADAPEGPRFIPLKQETVTIDGMAPHETRELEFNWTAAAGTFRFDVHVDPDGRIDEIEKRDSLRFQQVFISSPSYEIPDFPTDDIGGGTGPDTDLKVRSLSMDPVEVFAGQESNVRATVENAGPTDVTNGTVELRVYQIVQSQVDPNRPVHVSSEPLALAAGQSDTVTLNWTPNEVARYLIAAVVDPGSSVNETQASDNTLFQDLFVDRQIIYEEPEEKATIKQFFVQIISALQLRIVIPLLALGYAAGVLADPQRSGALVYLLTRPIPRWLIPLMRFSTSFIVAWLAVVVGSLMAFFMLLQSPEGNLGFLTAPLAIGTLALFAYTAVFVLLGVVTRWPYLWGLGFVAVWETFAGQLVPWVDNLTLNHHLALAFDGMDLRSGATWFPSGDEATGAVWRLLIIGFGALLASAAVMSRREFRLD